VFEWIEYHLLLGISHFHIYDRQPNTLARLLVSYVEQGVVTVHAWPNLFSPHWTSTPYDQQMAMDACILRHKHRHEWIVFLDTDEYIHFDRVPVDEESKAACQARHGSKAGSECSAFVGPTTVNEFISQVEASDPTISQLMFQSIFWGGKPQPNARSLFEQFTMRANLTAAWREKAAVHAPSVRFMWCHFASRLRCGRTAMANPQATRVHHFMIADGRSTLEPTGLFWWNKPAIMTPIEAQMTETLDATVPDDSMQWAAEAVAAALRERGAAAVAPVPGEPRRRRDSAL